MTPFSPANGLSRAEIVFNKLRDVPTGTLVPYEELPFPKEILFQIKGGVEKRLEINQQRTLACERGQGWRIVAGVAQVDLADRDRLQSVRRMRRALRRATTVDYREMSGQERQRADDQHIRIATAYAHIRSSGRKLDLETIKALQREHPNGF